MRALLAALTPASPGFLIIHINIILYSTAHWITSPVMPFLSKKLGADPVMYGYLQTFGGLAQLVGGPFVGWIVDIYGARFGMNISQVAGGLSYACLAVAFSVPMLFFAKIPTIFQHCLQAAQMCVTLLSTPEVRPKMIARLSLFYGIGFVCGPQIGGWLSAAGGENGHQLVSAVAAGLSFLCVVLNYCYLPPLLAADFKSGQSDSTSAPTKPKTDNTDTDTRPTKPKDRSFTGSFSMLANMQLLDLLLFAFLVGLALSSFYTSFALAAEPRFAMNESSLGSAMSFIGVTSMFVNAFVVPLVNRSLPAHVVVYALLLVLAAAFALLSTAASLTMLYVALVPLVFSMALFRAYSVSLISAAVPVDEAGTAIGFAHAASSLSGVVAPAITGHVFGRYGFEVLCMAQAAVVLVALAILFIKRVAIFSGARAKTE